MAAVVGACGGTTDPTPTPQDPASGVEWILPVEGLEWERARLLAVLTLPVEIPPDSIQILVNGGDRTQSFLPMGVISPTWRERSARHQAADGEEEEADDWESAGMDRRLQGILELGDLREGENLLAARFRTALGRPGEVQRRFLFRPRGRRVQFRVIQAGSNQQAEGANARIVLLPREGGEDVDLSPGSSHPAFPWPRPRHQAFVLTQAGDVTFFLPEGPFRAVATGGLLYGVDEWDVPEHGDVPHTFRLRREVDLPDTTTVDFHVHASPSPDSLVPLAEQVRAFLAAGVDILVASDHNTISDYRGLIAQLPGAAGRIRSIPGVETGLRRPGGGSWGHWNVWPLEPDPAAPPIRRGQVSSYGALDLPVVEGGEPARQGPAVAEMFVAYQERARELFARQRGAEHAFTPPVIQLNHPRGIQHNPKRRAIRRVHDWFNAVGYDPEESIPEALLAAPGQELGAMDFDVLEVWNRSSRRLYEEVRADWFGLLHGGRPLPATANTDTHTVAPKLAGYPLNVVFLPPGTPSGPRVSDEALMTAVRGGRMVGTDGPIPLLRLAAGGQVAAPGDTLSAPGGRIRVRLEARAASWVPLGEARVWVNGKLLRRGPAPPLEFDTVLEDDAWVVAEVGDLEGVPEDATVPGLYGLLVPRGLALGFTNAVYVDVDGDGRWLPPGARRGRFP